MTPVDWIIVLFVLVMALWGFLQGLIVGALSLIGFAAGAVAGARLAPLLLNEGSHSPYAPLFVSNSLIFLSKRIDPRSVHIQPVFGLMVGRLRPKY